MVGRIDGGPGEGWTAGRLGGTDGRPGRRTDGGPGGTDGEWRMDRGEDGRGAGGEGRTRDREDGVGTGSIWFPLGQSLGETSIG